MSLASSLVQPREPRAPSRVAVREVRCATLLHRMDFGRGAEYTANMYKGCTHGCRYCYAPSLTHDDRAWGDYVDVKINAPYVLERELRGLKREEVFLSSASDPYQPVEARYRVTRRCIEVLRRRGFPLTVLTRSPLVLRDLRLLQEFGTAAKVGMSITTVPDRRFEPGVPPLERRVDTLRKLSEAGVRTWVSLAPVVPGIVLVDLERLFDDLGEAGVSSVSFGVLRFAGYEESRKMFEGTAGMTTSEALAGRDDLVHRLTDLVRSHGMEAKTAESREPPAGEWSLDSFCA